MAAATQPPTERGRRARNGIIRAAAELFRKRGVRSTSVDDVLARAGSGKSQLYHYFSGKDDLVAAVLDYQLDRLLRAQAPLLDELDSWEGVRRWLDALPGEFAGPRGAIAACPLGAMAAELAADDRHRRALVAAFDRWTRHLADGLAAMRDRGDLRPDADPERLAVTTIAALQGGLLLARTYKDIAVVRDALDAAYAHLRSFAPETRPLSGPTT
jgi:AcrR family transcriptional regulator